MRFSICLTIAVVATTACQQERGQTPSAGLSTLDNYQSALAIFAAKPNLAAQVDALFSSKIWSAATAPEGSIVSPDVFSWLQSVAQSEGPLAPWLAHAQVSTSIPTLAEYTQAIHVMTAGMNQDTSQLATPGTAAASFQQASFAKVALFFAASRSAAEPAALDLVGNDSSSCPTTRTTIRFAPDTKDYDGTDPITEESTTGSGYPEEYSEDDLAKKINRSASSQAAATKRGADVELCADRAEAKVIARRQQYLARRGALITPPITPSTVSD